LIMNNMSGWDDLVFEDRRKDCGAYLLRHNYPFYITVSTLIVIVFSLSSMVFYKSFGLKRVEVGKVNVILIDYIEFKAPPAIKKVEVQKSSVSKRMAPKVVKEEVEMEEVNPPETKHIQGGKPAFPGGMEVLYEWLREHLEYPPIAKRMGLEDEVLVEFTVDENGRISNAIVVEGDYEPFNDEALRVVLLMPDWTPAEIDGVKTTQTYRLPIRFVLN
jgi:periplasmic protein TonB